jgi:hypothetical protein
MSNVRGGRAQGKRIGRGGRSRFGAPRPGRSTSGHVPPRNGAPMNTRTIAILALVIVVVLVIYLFFLR